MTENEGVTSKKCKCNNRIIGSQIRVFDLNDELLFPDVACELINLTATYIIVKLDEGDEAHLAIVPLATISQLDTLPEVFDKKTTLEPVPEHLQHLFVRGEKRVMNEFDTSDEKNDIINK